MPGALSALASQVITVSAMLQEEKLRSFVPSVRTTFETVDNAAQIMQGQTPGKLNAKGIEQAGEVARKMVNEPIDAFVSSDLYRSIQTCKIIARPHIEALSLTGNLTDEELDAHIVTTPLLRERDWGDFTGKFIPSLPYLSCKTIIS